MNTTERSLKWCYANMGIHISWIGGENRCSNCSKCNEMMFHFITKTVYFSEMETAFCSVTSKTTVTSLTTAWFPWSSLLSRLLWLKYFRMFLWNILSVFSRFSCARFTQFVICLGGTERAAFRCNHPLVWTVYGHKCIKTSTVFIFYKKKEIYIMSVVFTLSLCPLSNLVEGPDLMDSTVLTDWSEAARPFRERTLDWNIQLEWTLNVLLASTNSLFISSQIQTNPRKWSFPGPPRVCTTRTKNVNLSPPEVNSFF